MKRADLVLALALKHAKLDLQRRCKAQGIDWREAVAKLRAGETAPESPQKPVIIDERTPFVDE